jgi:hypothetical protein
MSLTEVLADCVINFHFLRRSTMYAKLIYLISFVFVLSLMGHVQAQDATWTDATGDHNWFTPLNWSQFPTPAHWAKIRNGLPGPTIASEGALASRVHIGYSEGGALTVDGGTLVISGDDLMVGKQGGLGILNMINGSITVARDFELAGDTPGGTGIVNMTGGTIIVGDDLEIPETETDPEVIAEMHLDGGSIIIGGDLHMFDRGTLDITAGTLIIDSNALSDVQGFIDNGWITAYSGNGTVQLDYDVTNEGQTTVKGIHKLKPYPVDGGIAPPGQVELSWTLPDPCTPGQPVLVDVYFTDDLEALQSFGDPASIRIVSHSNVTSVTVQTVPKTRYYWAVDTYLGGDDPNNNPLWGPVFSFLADNAPPEVNAGEDVTTWLENGSVDVALSGAVVDADATTTLWTVVTEPNVATAAIGDPARLDTTVTLTAVGTYVLELTADDGEKTGSDTLTINVYNDHCEAARSLPGWTPIPGDLNLDCVVNDLDLAILQENWLKCNGLDCPEPNEP